MPWYERNGSEGKNVFELGYEKITTACGVLAEEAQRPTTSKLKQHEILTLTLAP